MNFWRLLGAFPWSVQRIIVKFSLINWNKDEENTQTTVKIITFGDMTAGWRSGEMLAASSWAYQQNELTSRIFFFWRLIERENFWLCAQQFATCNLIIFVYKWVMHALPKNILIICCCGCCLIIFSVSSAYWGTFLQTSTRLQQKQGSSWSKE